LVGLTFASAWAQLSDRKSYTLATATTGGTSHPVGVTLSALIKLKLLPHAGIDMNAINTEGSEENVELMRAGDAQFSILTNLSAYYAWTGTGPETERGSDRTLRAITALWPSTHHFLVRKEFATTGTLADFANLEGRKVSLGRFNSGTLVKHQVMFRNLGIDIERKFELVDLGYADSARAFIDGEIDGLGISAGVPVSSLVSILEAVGDEAVLLETTPEELTLLDGGLDLWVPETIPAGSYPGQTEDLQTSATTNILGVTSDVSDDDVYRITKTIFDNLPFLHEMHPATKDIDLEHALNGLPMPVHPGALRYYKEVGINVPLLSAEAGGEIGGEAFLTRFRNQIEARDQLNAGTVGILGGPATQTFARMLSELAVHLDDPDVRVIGMNSRGSGQNIADVLYLKGVDGAMVQLDVLNYAAQENAYPALRSKIVYATELYPEEVHVVAAKGYRRLAELAGQKVNIGSRGSGSELTAAIMFDSLDLSITPTYYEAHAAIELLKAGEIAAAVFVSGKPMPLLKEIAADDDLTLLPVPNLQAEAYRPAEITAADYPAMLRSGQSVPTIAVRTALITYNWQGNNPRYAALTRFIEAFFAELEELQDDTLGVHPKWREIDLLSEIESWKRLPSARLWVDSNRDDLRAAEARKASDLPRPVNDPQPAEDGEILDPAFGRVGQGGPGPEAAAANGQQNGRHPFDLKPLEKPLAQPANGRYQQPRYELAPRLAPL
jgi:TRAP transporter TAXI family solute receptor